MLRPGSLKMPFFSCFLALNQHVCMVHTCVQFCWKKRIGAYMVVKEGVEGDLLYLQAVERGLRIAGKFKGGGREEEWKSPKFLRSCLL